MNQEEQKGIVLPPGYEMSLYRDSGEPVMSMPQKSDTETVFQKLLNCRVCIDAEAKNGRRFRLCGYLRRCEGGYLCIENETGTTLLDTSALLYLRFRKSF